MKAVKYVLIGILVIGALGLPAWWYSEANPGEDDPDFPVGMKVNKAQYLEARDEQIALRRGLDTAEVNSRSKAIQEMERAEKNRTWRPGAAQAASWKALGPAPIPNGQTSGRTDPVSGRTSAIAVDPTNANIVYSGTAQGGLYRSLDGGTTWTALMDGALSLAIGSVAVAPSDPSIVYVGTGEGGFSLDSFFGVGIYRINGANTATPVVTGPLNRDASNNDIFTGRAVSSIRVDPSNPAIIYAGSVSGGAGLGSSTGAPAPNRGLYRSSNATSGSPTFEKLTVSAVAADRPILEIVTEPGNPDRMFVTLVDTTGAGDGGVYFSTNATSAVPTWSRLLATGAGAELGRAELAIQKTGTTVTVYCAHGTASGTLSKAVYDSTAPGTPVFSAPGGGGSFCSGQCFYDIAVAVDPTNANNVYLAGSPTMPFGFSINGGTSFTSSTTGLHVDTHSIAVAPSSPSTIYYGSDGGIWKSTNSGGAWVSMNNTTYSATQFESIAVHPNDRNYTLGGTQDNGTEYLFPDGTTWTRAVGGDGGFVVIDSNSTTPTSMVSYHTFFNSTNSQIGFARSTTNSANGAPIYGGLLGCGGTANGINCADSTLFYAPLVLGPNAPGSTGNTVYFGTTHLYRSINQGTTMTDVSGLLPARISAIGIAPSNDDVRLAGTTAGSVFLSTTAAATSMTNVTGTIPARYVGRIAIDPTNSNIAYVALGGFGIPGQHVMKTTNLLSGTPTWSNSGSGIPDVPTNGLVIDPANVNTLYAGTDIGVFQSTDGGASWVPFSNGLPRVAVFEIAIQPTNRILKIATHGRGIYEYNLNARSAFFDYDADGKTDVSVFRPSQNAWYLLRSQAGFAAYQFGAAGDSLTPADYTGDGKTDVAIWRPSTGVWFILRSENNTITGGGFGQNGDIAAPGDYDGDGKADLAVYRPGASSTFFVQRSTAGFQAFSFGIAEDKPTTGDFDGDGKVDFAVYRPSQGAWYRFNSSNNSFYAVQFGAAGDKIVPADYTGDGKTDVAIWRPSNGTWFVLKSENLITVTGGGFGQNGDIPEPGDYDGDGKVDFAVYRPAQGVHYLLQTTAGFSAVPFGIAEDRPTPNAFVY